MADLLSKPKRLLTDDLYVKSSVEMRKYEDMLFSYLVSYVPNCYYLEGARHTFWGELLKNVAKELARLEVKWYQTQNNKDLRRMNPVDIHREFAQTLYVTSAYPSETQSDLEYAAMIVSLYEAFRSGAKVSSLEKIIKAYTGESLVVEELFRKIGSYYDQSDRNSLLVSFNASTESGNLAKLKILTDTLADALQRAKPAHVGITLNTVLGLDENLRSRIKGIKDHINSVGNPLLSIHLMLVEEAPLDPLLYQGPNMLDTPNTGLQTHLVFQWYKNGVAIQDATSPEYTTPELNLNDHQNVYTVRVNNGSASLLSSPATVNVITTGDLPDAPASGLPTSFENIEITRQPQSASVHVGDTLTLSVSAKTTDPVPGILSPRLRTSWEIKRDIANVSDVD